MDPRLSLFTAIAALAVGPAVAGLLLRQARMHALLDGFVLFMVAGLCLRSLLPHAYESIGVVALLVAAGGLVLPHFAETRLHHHRHGESPVILVLAVLGLMMHAALDGTTLAFGLGLHGSAPVSDTGASVTLAIVLHRLPVGLFIWWSVRPKLGRGAATGLLVCLGLSTLIGYEVSGALAGIESGVVAGVLHALLAGGLLHVVLEHGSEATRRREHRASSAIGGLVAIGITVLLPGRANPVILRAVSATWSMLLDSSPAIVLGFLGAGLLSLVPTTTLARLMSGRTPVLSALRGVVFGLPLPVCSCGVVPLYRSLMHKGVPAAAAMAFLVATPELGMDSILISIPLLGLRMALLRIAVAIAVAMIVGIVAGRMVPVARPLDAGPETIAAGEGSAVRRVWRYGFIESVDDLGPWIFTGLMAAGFLEPILSPALLHAIPRLLDVPVFAALATPLYICASGATPVAAVLLVKGVSVGAVLALLISGPATNVTTFGAIRSVHGTRTTMVLVLTIPIACVLIGMALDGAGITSEVPVVETRGHHVPLWKYVAAGIFGVLLLASLLRQGPRGFLRQLGIGHDLHAHEDRCRDEEEDGGHDHEHDEPTTTTSVPSSRVRSLGGSRPS